MQILKDHRATSTDEDTISEQAFRIPVGSNFGFPSKIRFTGCFEFHLLLLRTGFQLFHVTVMPVIIGDWNMCALVIKTPNHHIRTFMSDHLA